MGLTPTAKPLVPGGKTPPITPLAPNAGQEQSLQQLLDTLLHTSQGGGIGGADKTAVTGPGNSLDASIKQLGLTGILSDLPTSGGSNKGILGDIGGILGGINGNNSPIVNAILLGLLGAGTASNIQLGQKEGNVLNSELGILNTGQGVLNNYANASKNPLAFLEGQDPALAALFNTLPQQAQAQATNPLGTLEALYPQLKGLAGTTNQQQGFASNPFSNPALGGLEQLIRQQQGFAANPSSNPALSGLSKLLGQQEGYAANPLSNPALAGLSGLINQQTAQAQNPFGALEKMDPALAQLGPLTQQLQGLVSNPSELTGQILKSQEPMSQALQNVINKQVQAQVGSAGLGQSPGLLAEATAQALAPYQMQEQQLASQNVLGALGTGLSGELSALGMGAQDTLASQNQALNAALSGMGLGLQGQGQAINSSLAGMGLGLQGEEAAAGTALSGMGLGLQGEQNAFNNYLNSLSTGLGATMNEQQSGFNNALSALGMGSSDLFNTLGLPISAQGAIRYPTFPPMTDLSGLVSGLLGNRGTNNININQPQAQGGSTGGQTQAGIPGIPGAPGIPSPPVLNPPMGTPPTFPTGGYPSSGSPFPGTSSVGIGGPGAAGGIGLPGSTGLSGAEQGLNDILGSPFGGNGISDLGNLGGQTGITGAENALNSILGPAFGGATGGAGALAGLGGLEGLPGFTTGSAELAGEGAAAAGLGDTAIQGTTAAGNSVISEIGSSAAAQAGADAGTTTSLLASAAPILGAAAAVLGPVAALVASGIIPIGPNPGNVPEAQTEQKYEAASDDLLSAVKSGYIPADKAISALSQLQYTAMQQVTAAGQKAAGGNVSLKGEGNVEKGIQSIITAIKNLPPVAPKSGAMSSAINSGFVQPGTKGWYPGSADAGAAMADQIIQAILAQTPPKDTFNPQDIFAGKA